ncbi:glutamate synthase large subunit [Sinirhodobacter populi]|uniref:Glutamate synthase large subunit n=1 Tax=Paenirhodobacter populi TaxID=2306993 RepID=A0A443K4N1_9RHOB|nr:glutamate synthase-related protein [Sinirhodobacter populi]RWR27653.1 glutamate synthase large subunit [Sinirhodobacter populi]
MEQVETQSGLYDSAYEKSSCGVGFLTRKDGIQTHEILTLGHEALYAVPHRGGMSAEGVGDGAGISIDLSLDFFSALAGRALTPGAFGVGNFFLPSDPARRALAEDLVERTLAAQGLAVLVARDVPVDNSVLRPKAVKYQLPLRQWLFDAPEGLRGAALDLRIHQALLAIEAEAFTLPELDGLYPLSLSARMQVLKGRLNSDEIIPYFRDLTDPGHKVHTMYFHTRFSTNTDPHPSMAQPFRFMAHNGELNTDKKNRLSEAAIARAKNNRIVRPKGQSDSCRLDQTIQARVIEDGLDLVTTVVSMMPPAWENDDTLSPQVRAMLEYFSLYEEKNDGPAALIFGDGTVIGARLDRLGLRPLRTVETGDYLAVMSEAGQIAFPPESVIRRGRIEAGGMLYYDHAAKRSFATVEALEMIAARRDYPALLRAARVRLTDLPEIPAERQGSPLRYAGDLNRHARYVAYSLNQESFRFLMDPMLATGSEKVSAMGYGNAINALSDAEGGVAKYFSQRFAQVTNPPLDSIREADGMTLRVALGAKPNIGAEVARQIVVDSPILTHLDMLRIREQPETPVKRFEMLYEPVFGDGPANEAALTRAIDRIAAEVAAFAGDRGGIAVISDRHVCRARAAIPMTIMVSAINQKLIEEGLRLRISLIVESGQISSSHHIACALGFGAAAVYPLGVQFRAEEKFGTDADKAFRKFAKAAEKALMKTMGKVGLCTVESYSGGEFFEPNFLDTNDPAFRRYFPNVRTPVGGVTFRVVAQAVADWHERALSVMTEEDVPLLGLFKERAEGAGHSYGATAVRGFVDMTEEAIVFPEQGEETDPLRLMTLNRLEDAFGIDDAGYSNTSFDRLTPGEIDGFRITPGYRTFARAMAEERARRPAALRDVLAFPADVTFVTTPEEFRREMRRFLRRGNNSFLIRGLDCKAEADDHFRLRLTGPLSRDIARLDALSQSFVTRFGPDLLGHWLEAGALVLHVKGEALSWLSRVRRAPDAVPLDEVEPAHRITPLLASGAMSHGALVASAHEAVAHGTNMVGGMSNCGEGGEHITRHGTIRASRIKQFASGRFGVWAGYLADPMLEEIEIKIGQGAKPGEGGQLPAPKVTVEIAAARGGTPGVELVSPPPHHDTYSIEDLAQLIHDAKAARVRVVVKLVSSEGIGTIAVGVAKAGADVINVAGNTGGTGAASVTSLKYTGRAAEIGIAEVHQALCANGLRDKVVLRCSGAHQTASDMVKSALLGGDSFEFGTTALMMLKCVMAKNCNVKCPAGLTTNAEAFDGDPRALAQYLLNITHEVREVLAGLGLRSLHAARGRSDLLHLLDHPASVGQLDLRAMLAEVPEVHVTDPVYMPRDFAVDDAFLDLLKPALMSGRKDHVDLGGNLHLTNRDKSVGGQLAVDIERMLNHEDLQTPLAQTDDRGRRFLRPQTVRIATMGSAGQSYGAFCNDGMVMVHTGTCNDGVGKSQCGGEIVVRSPGGGSPEAGGNVLIGNFALFGATGGRCFVEGQAGDRFAVRNSGGTAVVEGVGDFCVEYMTNGAVLNLGAFGKGFANGMSGGFAYQYDPYGDLSHKASHDSVLIGRLSDGGAAAETHAQAVRQLLEWHHAATRSTKAEWLLANWAAESAHFAWALPRALLQYQDADEILKAKPRKDLLEELASALVAHQIRKLKKAWRHDAPVLRGQAPDYGETDTEGMFALLNQWTVLEAAQQIASGRLKQPVDHPATRKAAKNLILTEDFALLSRLLKRGREAVQDYSDPELAALVANKRLSDYKQALSLRNILSMDSPGTYGWILDQDRRNRRALGEIPSFDALFARNSLNDITKG